MGGKREPKGWRRGNGKGERRKENERRKEVERGEEVECLLEEEGV